MSRWEYLVLDLEIRDDHEKELNEAGERGWELATAVVNAETRPMHYCYVLKRLKP